MIEKNAAVNVFLFWQWLVHCHRIDISQDYDDSARKNPTDFRPDFSP